MKPELEKKLVKKYPKIFVGVNLPPNESLMCFGFECGDGWYDLIDHLCEYIQRMINANIKGSNWTQFVAVQVKEKFGRLRFYGSGGPPDSDMIFGAIEFAEFLSGKICEQCGKEGKLRGKGWIFTMCDECWKKKNES